MADADYILPVLEGLYLTQRMQDWRQTRTIADNPDRYSEKNKILGDHPSTGEVDRYMGGLSLGHLAGYYSIPREWQYLYQPLMLAEVSSAVQGNKEIGLGTSGKLNSLGAAITAALIAQEYMKSKDNNSNVSIIPVGPNGSVGLTLNYKW